MIAMGAFGPVGGALMRRIGPRMVFALGLAGCAVGGGLLAVFHRSVLQVGLGFFFIGLGWAMAITGAPALISDAVPRAQTGVANGLNSTARITGTLLGGQISVAILTGTALASGVPSNSGFTLSFWICCISALVAALLAFAARGADAPSQTARFIAHATTKGAM